MKKIMLMALVALMTLISCSVDNSDVKTDKIAEGEGHGLPATVSGTYDFDNGSITMTDDRYQGIAYSLKIQSLDNQLLEGLFTLWHETPPKNYTIRLQRKK